MIAVQAAVGTRHGRVFLRRLGPPIEELVEVFRNEHIDDEDLLREPLLGKTLARPLVRGIAHPGIDPDDIVDVYLHDPDPAVGPLFACVIVSEDRLAKMLEEAEIVVEGFRLQVAPGTHLTRSTLHASIEAWAVRNYPAIPLPRFEIEPST